jgi:hypothetical protein
MPLAVLSAVMGLRTLTVLAMAAGTEMNQRSPSMPVLINIAIHVRYPFPRNLVSRPVMK